MTFGTSDEVQLRKAGLEEMDETGRINKGSLLGWPNPTSLVSLISDTLSMH